MVTPKKTDQAVTDAQQRPAFKVGKQEEENESSICTHRINGRPIVRQASTKRTFASVPLFLRS